MRNSGYWVKLLLAGFIGLLGTIAACKTPKESTVTVTTADTFNIMTLERFFFYPVTDRQPLLLKGSDPQGDSLTYQRRLQHWYLLYDTKHYTKKYGALPKFYPGNTTLEQYKKNPARVPDEYNRIMFGYN